MTEIVCAGPVDDFTSFIADCRFPTEAFVLVERLPQQVVVGAEERQNLLRFARLSDGVNVTTYTSGRIFHADFELRWEKQEGKTQVVYLGTEESKPSLEFVCNLPKPKERYYYLLGEALKPELLQRMRVNSVPGSAYYAEVRIPRLLQYPELKGVARRVQLAIYEYRSETTGNLEWFRFQDLKAAE